jgi:secreted PhoX family phosphatase
MTGPTFVGDTLIISVQHPGENVPVGDGTLLSRTIEVLSLDGTVVNQLRTVPRSSNWPDNITGAAAGVPRPATIGIRRKPSANEESDRDEERENEGADRQQG